jgi:hypothetical protein
MRDQLYRQVQIRNVGNLLRRLLQQGTISVSPAFHRHDGRNRQPHPVPCKSHLTHGAEPGCNRRRAALKTCHRLGVDREADPGVSLMQKIEQGLDRIVLGRKAQLHGRLPGPEMRNCLR